MALKIHEDQIASFGGTTGVRDEGLLESALAQPQATFGGQFLHASIHEQAAAYLYHMAMNHPFIDGNKRTAYAAMDTFLRVNGYTLNLTDEESYALVLDVANGRMDKTALAMRLEECVIRTLE
jgi:death-on-curing protein